MKPYQLTTALAATLLFTAAATAQGGIPPGLRLQPGGDQKPSAAVPLGTPALPPANPTATTPLPPLPQAQSNPTAVSAVRRARVDYSNGLLTVSANNSSLNQILGSIARATGMKIAGGVTDERVYGTYGPADLPTILATLLNGTGSNMMLSGDNPDAPQLLTLTPRQGGVSPPSPPETDAADDAPPPPDLPPQLTQRTASSPVGPPRTENPPQPNAFTPPTAQPDASATTSAPTAAGTTAEQSPNGVKTPQQIYDQLMKLQSQQPKPPQ